MLFTRYLPPPLDHIRVPPRPKVLQHGGHLDVATALGTPNAATPERHVTAESNAFNP